jgi:hypothetical protein
MGYIVRSYGKRERKREREERKKNKTFIKMNNRPWYTWLMRESPFLRHISATTWATSTRQRKGYSTSTST